MAFGERLRREREMRGITLEEIATATKIGTRALGALEEEDFDKLPGGIFNKGFVRAYARYLGIDEDQALADYQAAVGEPDEKDILDPQNLKRLEANWKPPKHESVGDEALHLPWGAVTILVLLLALFLGWHYRHTAVVKYRQWQARRHPQSESTTTVALQPIPIAPSAPAAPATPAMVAEKAENPAPSTRKTAGVSTSSSPDRTAGEKSEKTDKKARVAAASDEFVVTVHARQDSWLSITADGKPVMTGMLVASRRTAIRAKQKITLLAGNAGGIEISFNGQAQPPLGADKQVRSVTFTPEGMQQ